MSNTDKERGLYRKYRVSKTSGEPIDPSAEFFVLRIDTGGDAAHSRACREALAVYANMINDHYPALSDDIWEYLTSTGFTECPCCGNELSEAGGKR